MDSILSNSNLMRSPNTSVLLRPCAICYSVPAVGTAQHRPFCKSNTSHQPIPEMRKHFIMYSASPAMHELPRLSVPLLVSVLVPFFARRHRDDIVSAHHCTKHRERNNTVSRFKLAVPRFDAPALSGRPPYQCMVR